MSETMPPPSVRAQVAGPAFTQRQPDVQRAVYQADPGEIRGHFVEVGDRGYPVKQALAIATGLDPPDFTSRHARSVLRQLCLRLDRLSAHPSAAAAGHARPDFASFGIAGLRGFFERIHLSMTTT
jgi:hypothetical protein